jgi:fibro-slime domain-containing protein
MKARISNHTGRTPALTLTTKAALAAALMVLPGGITAQTAVASEAPDTITLVGVLRDFDSTHSDFGITDPAAMGHDAWNVGPTLSDNGLPMYGGGGSRVLMQWQDKDGNYISPTSSDLGLPGGHFDVDVFDKATNKKKYHEHEYDDKFDVTYVDLMNDMNLLYHDIIGSGYPNKLRLEFFNAHHGSGYFTFQDGATYETGLAQAGFSAVFDPATLSQLRVDFASLSDMLASSPKPVQSDVVNRNDSFAIRMYDDTTNVLKYELTVYHHGDAIVITPGESTGDDSCGDAINDDAGLLGATSTAAVTDSGTFDEWYEDVPDTNESKQHPITLNRDAAGVYNYRDASFFPADGELKGNEGNTHNNLFTYTISASFTYHACTGQFFEFEGSDDSWLFIDGKRVIDLGGVNTPESQYIALDRLDLVDGQTYPLDFFFAHRRSTDESMFNMRTNIVIKSNITPLSASYD